MSTWSFTHIRKNPAVSDSAIESIIRAETNGARSLARLNGEYSFKDRDDCEWMLVTPNGFGDLSEEAAESCRRMSEHFETTVVMTFGQGNCMGMVFAVFERGLLIRHVSAADGVLYANTGEPFAWETEVFGDLSDESVGLYEGTLHKIAERLGLSGYNSSERWTVDRIVSLSSPPPLPRI
ncbi:MAG: hypothetical protein EAZ81_08505 [Verrucomicrobia bacterium]|nr:MAG: hypothetical protein EAZ81_08505 [Verrucomicrobiota bacterium]